MLIRPMFKGRERDLSPVWEQFLDWSAAEVPLTAESLLDAWARRDAVRAHFRQQTQQHPILLCPAADSRLPTRRTRMEDRRQDCPLS
jgi:hypothetical protein